MGRRTTNINPKLHLIKRPFHFDLFTSILLLLWGLLNIYVFVSTHVFFVNGTIIIKTLSHDNEIQEDYNIHKYYLFCLVVLAVENSTKPLLHVTYRNHVFLK